MWAAVGWGAVGASALLVGALIAYRLAPSRRTIAVVMALGTGLLIGSVSFELIDEALETRTVGWVALFVLVGAAVFTLGDWLLTRSGGGERKDPTGEQAEGSPLAIVLGSILDGIPESFVLGLTVLQGGVSLSLLAGVALSNLPEGMSSSSGLKAARWPQRRVVLMWTAVIVASALSAGAGYVLLDPASGTTGALVQAFAAGALLALLADTLLPEAYAVEGVLTGRSSSSGSPPPWPVGDLSARPSCPTGSGYFLPTGGVRCRVPRPGNRPYRTKLIPRSRTQRGGAVTEQDTSRAADDASTAQLVSRLGEQVSTLIRSELRLAQVELQQKGKRAGIGVGLFGGAGIVALFGAGALVACAILALALVMDAWLAALIVGVVLLAVAGILALLGRRQVQQATPPLPTEAVEGLKQDIQTVKERRH